MIQSFLTDKVLAYQYFQNFNADEAIDWSLEMLANGHKTPSILILAGFQKPANFFEIEQYLLESFKELSLQIPGRQEAIINFAMHYVKALAASTDLKKNLYHLYRLRDDLGEGIFFDFYLLHWAWEDLEVDDFQHYWNGATKENIESIIIDKAKQFLQQFGVKK